MAHTTITGVLRRWRRDAFGVSGYIYESEIWDEGEYADLDEGYFHETPLFWLYIRGQQVYKLPKDEEVK